MGYQFIYFSVAFLLAITSGFSLYFSWRYVEGLEVSRWTLPGALLNGFFSWYLCALILILLSNALQQLAINWLGGNGFTLATLLAMMAVLLQHQLLLYLKKK